MDDDVVRRDQKPDPVTPAYLTNTQIAMYEKKKDMSAAEVSLVVQTNKDDQFTIAFTREDLNLTSADIDDEHSAEAGPEESLIAADSYDKNLGLLKWPKAPKSGDIPFRPQGLDTKEPTWSRARRHPPIQAQVDKPPFLRTPHLLLLLLHCARQRRARTSHLAGDPCLSRMSAMKENLADLELGDRKILGLR